MFRASKTFSLIFPFALSTTFVSTSQALYMLSEVLGHANVTQRKMILVAVVCSAIVWVVVSGDPDVETLRREVENLKSVVVSLQDVCRLHSSEIKSLQKTAEDQQKTIEKQQVLIEKLLSENQDLKNKSRNWSFKRTGLVNQKSENVGEHHMPVYENSRVIRGYQESSHEGLLAEDQRNSKIV